MVVGEAGRVSRWVCLAGVKKKKRVLVERSAGLSDDEQ